MTSLQLEQAVDAMRVSDYTSLAAIIAVGYDYILTISDEIEYIWMAPWTWVSTLFVMVRYCGLCQAILSALFGTSFFPVPEKACVFPSSSSRFLCLANWSYVNRCEICYLAGLFSFWIFSCAAELVMILRVWAVYNQSRLVLGILLTIYVIEVIPLLVFYIIRSVPWVSGSAFVIARILQFSFCGFASDTPNPVKWLGEFPMAAAITLSALMCLLTGIRFIKESLQVYKERKCFRLNRYMKHLARDATVYFSVVLLFELFTALVLANINTTNGWLVLLATTLQQVPPVTLGPRFIMSLRELYARDVHRGSHIDTAFGFSGLQAGHDAIRSAIVFADARQDKDEEQGEREGEGIQTQEEGISHEVRSVADRA